MAMNVSDLASALHSSGLTEEEKRRIMLLNGIDRGNIRQVDALAHAALASAETSPTAQRGAAGQGLGDKPSGGTTVTSREVPNGTGDKLVSADVLPPSSLRPVRGTGKRGSAEPVMGYREIKEAVPAERTVYQKHLKDYDGPKDRLLDRLEREKFSYDPAADPVWQAYQKQYRREGQRASQDALGRASSMTGGVPSSYAVSAAAQAENNYAAQLSDRLPEIYQSAYSRYLREYDRLLSLADAYERRAKEENDWQRALRQYQDRLQER